MILIVGYLIANHHLKYNNKCSTQPGIYQYDEKTNSLFYSVSTFWM